MITTDSSIADSMDPYILIAKTLMLFGLLLSIYLRIESTNGNLHNEAEILRTSFDCIHLEYADGSFIGSKDLPAMPDSSIYIAPNRSIFLQQQVDADVSTVIHQRAKIQKA